MSSRLHLSFFVEKMGLWRAAVSEVSCDYGDVYSVDSVVVVDVGVGVPSWVGW
jgi:hypothetical protein